MRYGRKGGDGATTGKKGATYEARFPNGDVVQKRDFHVKSETAYIGIYYSERDQEWQAAGVTSDVVEQDGTLRPIYGGAKGFPSSGQIALPAKRVK